MAYQVRLYPEWSWSQSRQNIFEECPRKYYYHYYASHNGWLNDASSDAQRVYRLKQLKNLYLIFGEAIHNMAEMVVRQWVQKKKVFPADDLLQRVRNLMNQAYKDSLDRERWWNEPKRRTMLNEMYYEGELPQQVAETVRQRISVCVANFLKSFSLTEFTQNPTVQVVEIEQLNSLIYQDTKIYVKLDLMYRLGDKWIIVDWKTGQEDERNTEQLKLYALYVHERYGIPLNQIEVRTEYLLTGECICDVITQEDLTRLYEQIGRGLNDMRSFLSDPSQNAPSPVEVFPATSDSRNCYGCNFREICDVKLL